MFITFNNRALGINRSEIFLKNICSQLIAAYNLNHSVLPPKRFRNSQFFLRILQEISEKLELGQTMTILVDALDETEDVGLAQGANLLNLPWTLPTGIYMVITSRTIWIYVSE